jgi:signal peptidase II
MITKNSFRLILILSVILVNISCDQVSKKMVRQHVQPYETINVVKSYFTITNVENSGAFLSVGNSLPPTSKSILLLLFPLAAIAAGFAWILFKRNIPRAFLVGTCFVIGGGIGNLFDRISYGSVTDFLHIDLGFFHTGIFNLADLSIMTGVAIIFFGVLLKGKSKNEPTEQLK